MGTQLPLLKKGLPKCPAHVYCGQMTECIKMPLGMVVCLIQEDFLLDADVAPLHKKTGRSSQFSAHVYCGQTAGCIKMPLGMEVDLSPGDFVLDGDPASSPQKGGGAPQFSAHVCVAKRVDGPRCHLVQR